MSDPVGSGTRDTGDQIQQVACKIGCGVGEVREVIRAQPIAAALAVFALGYLFGRPGSLIPSLHSSATRR